MADTSKPASNAEIPDDDGSRQLALARPDSDRSLMHLGVVGDTYTILLTGEQTAGRFALIDMFIPAGGGPPPHRHDFEETFHVLEGTIQVTFREKLYAASAGETVNIPANVAHAFRNATNAPARLLCTVSPPGLEAYFAEFGQPVSSRTEAPPKLDPAAQTAMMEKAFALAPKYRIENLAMPAETDAEPTAPRRERRPLGRGKASQP